MGCDYTGTGLSRGQSLRRCAPLHRNRSSGAHHDCQPLPVLHWLCQGLPGGHATV